jgi:Dolichyl-phosphate-mannose-protein mannosyltransferase
MRPTERITLLLLFAGLLAARLCHTHIVWVEEAYPTAAAIQLTEGKALYRDIWFDKPPLSPALYLLWKANIGVPLRIAGAVFVFGCCLLLYRLAARLWSTQEGLVAALLLGFFLTFGIPAAVIALAPDLLMIAPHIAAVYFAIRGKPVIAGLMAGLGLLVNSKAVFILVACLLWLWRDWVWTLAGFALPNIAAFIWFGQPYYEQVWKWGAAYSQHAFSFGTGFLRTADWLGFQSAIVIGALWFLWKERSWRMLAWLVISMVGVAAGWRFFPRYYFQLLVPVTLMAARGYVLLRRRRAVLLLLLLIPLVRFGPRYAILANDLVHGRAHQWSDLRLNQDSEAAARLLAGKHGTLLVWGYRPDVFAYTRMAAGTRFLDSQPLTGVIADRHLTNSEPSFPELAARNREELKGTQPTYIVDGLGPLNAKLAITNYADLREWLSGYREIGRTDLSVVYERQR